MGQQDFRLSVTLRGHPLDSDMGWNFGQTLISLSNQAKKICIFGEQNLIFFWICEIVDIFHILRIS